MRKFILLILVSFNYSLSYSQEFPNYSNSNDPNISFLYKSDNGEDPKFKISSNHSDVDFIKIVDKFKFIPNSSKFSKDINSFKKYISNLSQNELFEYAVRGDYLSRTEQKLDLLIAYNTRYNVVDSELYIALLTQKDSDVQFYPMGGDWDLYGPFFIALMLMDGYEVNGEKVSEEKSKLLQKSSNSFPETASSDPIVNKSIDGDWRIKGIKRVDIKNPNTGTWDEILFFNPGKYIEIKDEKDLKITDLDILAQLFGTHSVGIYQSAVFEDGVLTPTNVSQTNFYVGNLRLSNKSRTNEKVGKAGVYFMWGNGQKLVELRNDICKCYVRFYYSDEYGLKNY
jgi:hypothetical protein